MSLSSYTLAKESKPTSWLPTDITNGTNLFNYLLR